MGCERFGARAITVNFAKNTNTNEEGNFLPTLTANMVTKEVIILHWLMKMSFVKENWHKILS